MNIANIAMIPYSSGDNIRAIIRPIIKFTPAVENRSNPLHTTPLIVFLLVNQTFMKLFFRIVVISENVFL